MDNRPIGMFDSGVGGITVFKEVIETMPNESMIYIGDTASFPYGSKSKETIIDLTKRRIETLIQKDVKLIVIACGTATSQALEEVQKMFDIPIIGIIKPTIKYLKKNNIKDIGIVATSGTIRSNGWEKEIMKEIPDAKVQNKACPLLAPMAEEGWTENEIAKLSVHEYMKDIKNIEALVLGCTHYPLFKASFLEEVGEDTKVINTGEMVSLAVKEYIEENNIKNDCKVKPTYSIYLTDTECNFLNVAKQLIKDEEIIKQIKKI